MYKDPTLCDFNKVELKVPKIKLLRLYLKRSFLDQEEVIFLKALLWQAEAANHKILHIQSIIEKSLLKTGSLKVASLKIGNYYNRLDKKRKTR